MSETGVMARLMRGEGQEDKDPNQKVQIGGELVGSQGFRLEEHPELKAIPEEKRALAFGWEMGIVRASGNSSAKDRREQLTNVYEISKEAIKRKILTADFVNQLYRTLGLDQELYNFVQEQKKATKKESTPTPEAVALTPEEMKVQEKYQRFVQIRHENVLQFIAKEPQQVEAIVNRPYSELEQDFVRPTSNRPHEIAAEVPFWNVPEAAHHEVSIGSKVDLKLGQIVFEGISDRGFDPRRLFSGVLMSAREGGDALIAYPHLDKSGKIESRTMLRVPLKMLSELSALCMGAVSSGETVKSHPDDNKDSYVWLAGRIRQMFDIAERANFPQAEKDLDGINMGKIIDATFGKTSVVSESHKQYFNDTLKLLSKEPFATMMKYLDAIDRTKN